MALLSKALNSAAIPRFWRLALWQNRHCSLCHFISIWLYRPRVHDYATNWLKKDAAFLHATPRFRAI